MFISQGKGAQLHQRSMRLPDLPAALIVVLGDLSAARARSLSQSDFRVQVRVFLLLKTLGRVSGLTPPAEWLSA